MNIVLFTFIIEYNIIMFGYYKINEKLAKKLNIFNYIKSFSMPDFPNLNIFSKTFFNDLFLKMYKNDNIYTLLYGDIDGLRKLNDNIGFDKANIAIENLLKTVLNYLPENVIASRVGGDEFCFIIPDLSADETRKLTKQIHESLESDEAVKGLSITFGACDSSEFDNINDMYTFVENKVNLKKHSHLQFNKPVKDIDDYNKKLDELIDCTIKTYIKNFRFSSNRYFKPKDLKILSFPIINTITNLLHNNYLNNDSINDDIDTHLNLDNWNSKLDYSVTTKIYDLIMNDNMNDNDLDSISIRDLKNFRNHLATDSITGASNNVYRDHYLLPRFEEDEIPFKVILIESLGIKMLNSISSHTDTDLKIKSTFNCLMNELKAIIPKNSNIRLFPIHSGGGTFEIIVQNDTTDIITPDVIDSVINSVNLDNTNIKLFGMVEACPDASDYDNIHSELSKICEDKKDKIKDVHNYFISPDALKLLDVSLSSVVNFFEVQAKDLGIYNEHSKKEFSQKIINSLIDNFHDLNLSNNLYEENEFDYSR